jgi:regulation of enolase protein 1 (concanavalin A-like superfamily)
MASKLSSVNTNNPPPNPLPQQFTLSADPKTDVYAAPAHGHVWTAPIIYKTLKASAFKKASLSITLNWTTTFDQGGLILVFPTDSNPVPDKKNASNVTTHPRWVKAGIEINEGHPWISAVGRDVWADWSLASPPAGSSSNGGKTVQASIEFLKHENALMIFVKDGEEKRMIREIQWPFLDEQLDRTCWIGVYVCRPDAKGESDGPLEVSFEDFVVES